LYRNLNTNQPSTQLVFELSPSDLLLFELDQEPGVSLDDVREVSNYVAALEHGLARLSEGFPLCLRLLREVHGVLLAKGRGSRQTPGEFRISQNWIGGSRLGNAVFVPPPPDRLLECLGQWESFLHDQPAPMSVLLKAALAHAQFETIHPFLDGNGRLGRLLITLLLCDQKVLRQPMLYLSLYFKTRRQTCYELLNRVRLTGDWESWLDFFADAVIEYRRASRRHGAAIAEFIQSQPRDHRASWPRIAFRAARSPRLDGTPLEHCGNACRKSRRDLCDCQQVAPASGASGHRIGTHREEAESPVLLYGVSRHHEPGHGTARLKTWRCVWRSRVSCSMSCPRRGIKGL
jgi:hypothetical protein